MRVKCRRFKYGGVKSRGVKSRGVKSRGVKSRGVKSRIPYQVCYIICDNQYNNLVNLERELEITILEVFRNILLMKFNKLHTY